VDSGHSTADIAARRGCPESHVAKLLKLANCRPVLLKAYREEQLSLEQLMAYAVNYTVNDDHEAQELVPARRRTRHAIRDPPPPDAERGSGNRQAGAVCWIEVLRKAWWDVWRDSYDLRAGDRWPLKLVTQ
jgi:ParB family chromosome partitioning protein